MKARSEVLSRKTSRVISKAEMVSIIERASAFIQRGGEIDVGVHNTWMASTRWARNRVISAEDNVHSSIGMSRNINGAISRAALSNHSDQELKRAVEACERLLQRNPERQSFFLKDLPALPPETTESLPDIWHPSTIALHEDRRADIFHQLTYSARKEGMLSAGYIEVLEKGICGRDDKSEDGFHYHRFTDAQLSITVRSPDGLGSGWAGVSWDNWDRINGEDIANVALEKCLRSRNPVSIEPGRYMVVLEPQATHEIVKRIFDAHSLQRAHTEDPQAHTVYTLSPGQSKLGLQMFDRRLKVHTDPYHPECSYYPYEDRGGLYRRATWIEDGVLVNLAYPRGYAVEMLGKGESLQGGNSYILEGIGEGTGMDVKSMIENTERGLLVTRLHFDQVLDEPSMLITGTTRDGLWLIEKGKLTQSVRNLRFTESPVFVLNNVLEYGVPTRVFEPGSPCLVPALRVRDFSFTATINAI